MVVSVPSSINVGIGNGSTPSFNFTFTVGSASDVAVIYTVDGVSSLLPQTSYTVALNARAPTSLWHIGGTITYPIGGPNVPNGATVTMFRRVPFLQTEPIANQGNQYPQATESALDTLCMEIQQIASRTGQFLGVWQPFTFYNYNDVVIDGMNGANTGNYYFCTSTGTSTSWDTDLAAGKWAIFINVQSINTAVATAIAAASTATTQAGIATAAQATATTQAGIATAAQATATTQAGIATAAQATATTQAGIATAAQATATTQAGIATAAQATATTQAGIATTAAGNAAASAIIAASTLTGTSTTSNTIGTGSFTFTTQTNKQFQSGQFIEVNNGSNFMTGSVTSYNSSTGVLVINSSATNGSGTFTSWNISIAGAPGQNGSGTGTVTSVAVSSANGVSASVTSPTSTPTLSFTLGDITPSSVASAGVISAIGAGSATDASAATQPGIFSGGDSPTAGNIYGIAVAKSGYEDALFGVNKNTTTSEVPASALYISTYNENGQIAIGRGNTAGAPKHADILINSSGNVAVPNNLSVTGTVNTIALSGSSTPVLSVTGTSSLSGDNSGDQFTSIASNTFLANADGSSGPATASVTLSAKQLAGCDESGNLGAIGIDSSLSMTGNTLSVVGTSPVAATQTDQETATSTSTFVSPGTQQYHPSSPKAWVTFDGSTGSVAAGYNVSSVTKNGTADFTVNFTVPFSSTAYAAILHGTSSTTGASIVSEPSGSKTVSSYRLVTRNSSASAFAVVTVYAAFWGDQ